MKRSETTIGVRSVLSLNAYVEQSKTTIAFVRSMVLHEAVEIGVDVGL